MSPDIDLTEARKFIVSLMPQAGEILREQFNTRLKASYKNPKDLVTKADSDVDIFLRDRILRQFPGAKFLTEETAPDDFSSLRGENDLWVIDSLDGTWNFFRGIPNFAISVGLVDQAVTKMAVVFVPMSNKLYWAQEDIEHVFLNNKQVEGISGVNDISQSSFMCDWVPEPKGRRRVYHLLGTVLDQVAPIKSMGSAVADLSLLIEGKIDAYLNVGLKPWDVAATSLFVRKEGATITTPEGKKHDVFESDIFVATPRLHLQYIQRFQGAQ